VFGQSLESCEAKYTTHVLACSHQMSVDHDGVVCKCQATLPLPVLNLSPARRPALRLPAKNKQIITAITEDQKSTLLLDKPCEKIQGLNQSPRIPQVIALLSSTHLCWG